MSLMEQVTTPTIDNHTIARFWSKVDKNGPIPDFAPELGPCWIYNGGKDKDGYGQFSVGYENWRAHRFSYVLAKGKIPSGLKSDHLCRVPSCVNPDHIEPVTTRENYLRGISQLLDHTKTHCKRGHELTQENSYFRDDRGGQRECKTCVTERAAVYYKAHYEPRERKKKTHCKRGHEFTPENSRFRPDRPGQRECYRCILDRVKKWKKNHRQP